jgi:hypothetical protein
MRPDMFPATAYSTLVDLRQYLAESALRVYNTLRFDSYVTHAAYDAVTGLGAILQGYYFNWICQVVRAQDQMTVIRVDVLDCASSILAHRVHITFALSVRSQRIVVPVEQQRGAWHSAGIHAHSFLRIRLDDYKAFPTAAVPFHFPFQALQEALLELQHLPDVHTHDPRFGGSDVQVSDGNIVKLVFAGRKNRGALVDFHRIDEIEHRKMLYIQNFVHSFQTEAALMVQKVGYVGLFETGLVRQTQASEIPCVNALPQNVPEIFLQHTEFHRKTITDIIAICYCLYKWYVRKGI